MRVAPISNMYANKSAAVFKGQPKEARPMVSKQTPDDEIVCYSNWGGNYVFPIYAKDVKKMSQEQTQVKPDRTPAQTQYTDEGRETPEEYYQRKLYSPEWCM